jgi:hypothetical protein
VTLYQAAGNYQFQNPLCLPFFKGEDVLVTGVGMQRLAMSETIGAQAQFTGRFFAHVPKAVLRQPVCQNATEPNRLDSDWSLKSLAFKKDDMEIKSVRHLNFWRCADVWTINCDAFLAR